MSKFGARQRRNKKFLIGIKKRYGCWCCKEKTLCILSFHHLDKTTKNHKVCLRLANHGMRIIMEELSKCCCLCLNCHRKVECGLLSIGEESLIKFI